jgi:hypothetical protein
MVSRSPSAIGNVPTGVKATVCSNMNKKLRKIVNSESYDTAKTASEAICRLILNVMSGIVSKIAGVACTVLIAKTCWDVRASINSLGKRHCLFVEWSFPVTTTASFPSSRTGVEFVRYRCSYGLDDQT